MKPLNPSKPSPVALSTVKWGGWLLFALYLALSVAGLGLQQAAGWFESNSIIIPAVNSFAFLIWAFGGGLIISRQPRHPIGWLFSITALAFAMDDFALGYGTYGGIAHPGSLPGSEAVMLWWNWTGRALGAYFLSLLFALFPNGRPLSQRWQTLLRVSTAAVVIYAPASAIAPLPIHTGLTPFPENLLGAGETLLAVMQPVAWVTYFMIIVSTILAIISLMTRLTRSSGVERQQLKWFFYASCSFIPGIFFLITGLSLQEEADPLIFLIGAFFITLVLVGIPIASTIAIWRYRLWDIDVVINRTLVYVALTAMLITIYFTGVISLQAIFGNLTGQADQLAIVLSTLTIAGLFNPLRNRIQNNIDSLFYRKKYDAEKILTDFAAPLRNEIDIDRLTCEMLWVVEDTLQPENTSIWLHPLHQSRTQG